MSKMQDIFKKTEEYVLDLAGRAPLSFVRGEGSYLFDAEGRRYLDFLCGVAVTSLGHAHPEILATLETQSKKLIHVSNLFHIEEQSQLAQALIQRSFPGKAFFFNSGTEANEAAFKLCRRYAQEHKKGAFTVLSLKNSFHGRSTASICLSGQEKIHSGFGPLLPGHIYVPPNDINALEKELGKNSEKVCAFFIELIQGESGIHPLEKEYVSKVRKLCTQHKILLVVDEVQTGIGRTGKLFCYEHYDILPDIMTLAKALGSGIPIGALVVSKAHTNYLQRGQHGTTMGGNPLAAKIALETLLIIERHKLLDNVDTLSQHIFKALKDLQQKFSNIKTIRGMGFHIGIDLKDSAPDFVQLCREQGLLLNATGNNTIRIMPPLTVSRAEIDEGLGIIESVLA